MAERYIPEHRRTQFKAKGAFASDVVRRRREEQQVEIRKAKREENLAKRRGIGTGENRPGASLGAAPDSDDDTAPTESQVCLHSIPQSCLEALVWQGGRRPLQRLVSAMHSDAPLRRALRHKSPLISIHVFLRQRARLGATHFKPFANPCDVTPIQETRKSISVFWTMRCCSDHSQTLRRTRPLTGCS